MKAIPTNLIIGFLGVGKTSAVLDLLKRKNPLEKWAVLVNEYGTVAIDDAFIEGEITEGVSVRSVAGGCFCCTTAPMLPVALHFLFQESTPDRLLIETSGLGHPAKLLDTLRMDFAGRLDVRATIGLTTPSDFRTPGMIETNTVFQDQITMADILVLNKAELADAETLRDFQTWANALDPPKLLIAATTQGRLEPAWLDLTDPTPRHTVQRTGEPSKSAVANGWIFSADVMFHRPTLLRLFAQDAGVERLKAVLHTDAGWKAFNGRGDELTETTTAYRRDSRIEVIADLTHEQWEQFAKALHAARLLEATSP